MLTCCVWYVHIWMCIYFMLLSSVCLAYYVLVWPARPCSAAKHSTSLAQLNPTFHLEERKLSLATIVNWHLGSTNEITINRNHIANYLGLSLWGDYRLCVWKSNNGHCSAPSYQSLLQSEQYCTVAELLCSRDTINLLTGWRKSLVYQVLPVWTREIFLHTVGQMGDNAFRPETFLSLYGSGNTAHCFQVSTWSRHLHVPRWRHISGGSNDESHYVHSINCVD